MKKQSSTTVNTLANATALTVAVIKEVMGDEIGNTAYGSPVTRKILTNIVASRVSARFAKYNRAGV